MIYQATQDVSTFFTMRDIRHRVLEDENRSVIEANFVSKTLSGVTVAYISVSEHNDVAVRVMDFLNLRTPPEAYDMMLETLNRLNRSFRFAKLCMRDNGAVTVEYDLPQTTGADIVGPACREIFIRFMQVLDTAAAEITKTWVAATQGQG